MRINERHIKILELISKFGYISEKMISDYFDLSKFAVDKIGVRLQRAGLIKKEKVLVSERQFWMLDKLGSEIMGVRILSKISPGTIIHNSYVFALAINYLKQSNKVLLEREIRQELGVKFGTEIFLPDILINDCIALEIELTLKSPKRLIKKIAKYNIDSKISEVHWISNKEIILKKLQKLCNGLKHKFFLFNVDILSLVEYENNFIINSDRKFLK